VRRAGAGHAATEFLLCVASLATALFAPLIEGRSAMSYLAHLLVAWLRGLFELLALS